MPEFVTTKFEMHPKLTFGRSYSLNKKLIVIGSIFSYGPGCTVIVGPIGAFFAFINYNCESQTSVEVQPHKLILT